MRFRAQIKHINTFIKLAASLNSLGKIVWLRLDDTHIRFTVIPTQGSQVWAVLLLETLFETYTIQSARPANTIDLEVPLAPLLHALRSAQSATSASIRLTKKDGQALLSLTILTATPSTTRPAIHAARDAADPNTNANARGRPRPAAAAAAAAAERDEFPDPSSALNEADDGGGGGGGGGGDDFALLDDDDEAPSRETTITQDIPVRVLYASQVESIYEPRCREPDVYIQLPPLLQLKAISERYVRLALAASHPAPSLASASTFRPFANSSASTQPATASSSSTTAACKLTLSASMRGELRLGIRTDALRIESLWTGLVNPDLDPEQTEGGEEGVRTHPSAVMKGREGEERWGTVRVEGRDWGRVLGVGRLGGRVVACFCHDFALILYVYLPNEDGADESVLTYYISSYSA